MSYIDPAPVGVQPLVVVGIEAVTEFVQASTAEGPKGFELNALNLETMAMDVQEWAYRTYGFDAPIEVYTTALMTACPN